MQYEVLITYYEGSMLSSIGCTEYVQDVLVIFLNLPSIIITIIVTIWRKCIDLLNFDSSLSI